MARGDWVDSSWVAMSKRKNCKVGLSWRYANTEEEAKLSNKDIIEVKPFIVRTGDSEGWAYNNNWYDGSYYSYKIGSNSENKHTFSTRYWYGSYDSRSHIDNNSKYYLKYTSDSTTTAKKANPIWTKSQPSTSVVSGSSILFRFEVPHKTDGTSDSLTIKFHLSGASEHGNGDVSVTFTPTQILRGTKIWRKNGNNWERVGTIGVKDHSATEQHYIYKKRRAATSGDSGWERIYG